MTKSTPLADALSFVVPNPAGGGFDYWSVPGTGNYGQDCEIGRALGAEFLGFLALYPTVGNGTLLGCIVGSMIEKGDAAGKGLRVGFLGMVGKAAMGGAILMQEASSQAA